MSTIRIDGLRELQYALTKTLPRAVHGRVQQRALSEGAKPIIAQAKALAPKRTGLLRRAIYSFRDRKSKPDFASRLITVRAGKKHGKRDAFYFRWVEFGRGALKVKRAKVLGTPKKGFFGRSVGAAPAKPFLRPAFDAQREAAAFRIAESLKVEIQRAADKIRGTMPRR